MFLPTTIKEVHALGWNSVDVILITGDSYIDSPFVGVSVIGKMLLSKGFKVGVIAQPDTASLIDIGRLGEPNLFWGITAGCVDSMVANYTALLKKRKTDDYTPGGINNRRPDRASIVYSNLVRRFSKELNPGKPVKPIVLGGIEASLRRVAHYDYWSDSIRRSILFDAKADYLLFGMAEKSIIDFALKIKGGVNPRETKGVCYISKDVPDGYIELPSFEEVSINKDSFTSMFHVFYQNNDPVSAKGLAQKHSNRYLIQNPPFPILSQDELDSIYSMDFENNQHPFYEKKGYVRALDTIKFSISSHRGCYGECNFCAIAIHEGRTVQWRSKKSIIKEAEKLTALNDFKGYIFDVGGPTANMYGFECEKKIKSGICLNKRCVFPQVCPVLKVDHSQSIDLLKQLRKINKIKKVFIASGIRYDLIFADKQNGPNYLENLVTNHVSGQLKIAPEHTEGRVLEMMGKPDGNHLLEFKTKFDQISKTFGKKQFLTYYFIAAHPGCSDFDMHNLKEVCSNKLKINPEQVQVFTPTPSTYSTLMYYTEKDPFTGKPIFVEKNLTRKRIQKNIVRNL